MTTEFHHGYLADYPAWATQLPGRELAWLQGMREQAFETFRGGGFPHNREEEWRYTHLAALNKTQFKPTVNTAVALDWLAQRRLADAYCAVLVNGHYCPELSALSGLAAPITLIGLKQALQQCPDKVRDIMARTVGDNEHSLIAFNSAWAADGLFIDIPERVRLDKPLQILHVVSETDALAATRNLITLGAQAEAEIVESYVGEVESYFTAAVNEISLGNNAGLTLTKVQCEAAQAQHFGGTYLQQSRDSRFLHHNFAFGSLLARSDVHSDLHIASECRLNGLYLVDNRQHIDNHTRINHLQPHGVSREFYKGVLDRRGRGVFQGRVVVAQDAQHTDSEMNNRNLLLSTDAEIDTKPQLEIYADDVKCSHGVTVGQLEDKSVFYLQSRGVDATTAKNILTFAFANEMVDKVENAAVKSALQQQLLVRFPAMSL